MASEIPTGVEVGQLAPDFDLPSHGGGQVKLSDFRGKKSVVIIFYPGDATPICTAQLCSFKNSYEVFQERGYEILGINSDSIESHRNFAVRQGLTFPLLSDQKQEVCAKYGVAGKLIPMPKRAIFLVDPTGVIRYKHIELTRLLFRKADAILELLQKT